MATQLVAYLRVSTKEQGQSGLGLEAQKAAVEAYARANGNPAIRWFTEIETGKIAERPKLQEALAHCRRSKATLVVAKLDRLARNVAFLSALMDSNVPFVACDNPHANRLTLHILAAVAEAEAKAISERTKAALAAYKARGGRLGGQLPQCRNLTEEAKNRGRRNGAKTNRAAALEAVADLVPVMRQLKAEGLSLAEIAERLNAEGHVTRGGATWTAVQVFRTLKRTELDRAG
jgi:DNA invertase Pin-like site-specific DNA recombinase